MYNETHFEKLRRFMSVSEMSNARDGMELKLASSVCQDYAGECPLTNVLTDMVEHLEGVEVGVDGEQAEFYEDDTRFCLTIPLTSQLQDWQLRFFKGENVGVGMIYIGRDETLPEGEQLAVGIDYAIGNYNLDDADLRGIESRITRKHIDESIRGCGDCCAVAIALADVFIGCEVNVSDAATALHDAGNIKAELHHSQRLSDWIDAYDNENDVGTFTLIIKEFDDKEAKGNHYLLDIKELSERQRDLQNRISRLTELSSEMELFIQKLTDRDEAEFDKLMREYDDLCAETVQMFG